MTAPAEQIVKDDCIACDGSGQTSTGVREYETGVWITKDCGPCEGSGQVDARWISECADCQGNFWTGDGCEHGDTLCPDCRPSCGDCAQERRDDADYEAFREFMAFGGAA